MIMLEKPCDKFDRKFGGVFWLIEEELLKLYCILWEQKQDRQNPEKITTIGFYGIMLGPKAVIRNLTITQEEEWRLTREAGQ